MTPGGVFQSGQSVPEVVGFRCELLSYRLGRPAYVVVRVVASMVGCNAHFSCELGFGDEVLVNIAKLLFGEEVWRALENKLWPQRHVKLAVKHRFNDGHRAIDAKCQFVRRHKRSFVRDVCEFPDNVATAASTVLTHRLWSRRVVAQGQHAPG